MPQQVIGKVKGQVAELQATKEASGIRRIKGYASKPVVDRMGDIVELGAFAASLPRFQANPVLLYMHDVYEPIGKWDTFELREDGFWVEGEICKGIPMADKAWTLITHGALRALSIGFREIDAGPEEDGHYHIRRLDLLEISVVAVPANQDAMFDFDDGGKLLNITLLPEGEKPAASEVVAASPPSPAPVSDTPPSDSPQLEFDFGGLGAAALLSLVEGQENLQKRVEDLEVQLLDVQDKKIEDLEVQLLDAQKALMNIVKFHAVRLATSVDATVAGSPSQTPSH